MPGESPGSLPPGCHHRQHPHHQRSDQQGNAQAVVNHQPRAEQGAAEEPSALDLPSTTPMTSRQVLEHLEGDFGLWLPKNSEGQRLPAAALSSR